MKLFLFSELIIKQGWCMHWNCFQSIIWKMCFRQWKFSYFYSNFTEFCSWRFNWWYVSIGSGNIREPELMLTQFNDDYMRHKERVSYQRLAKPELKLSYGYVMTITLKNVTTVRCYIYPSLNTGLIKLQSNKAWMSQYITQQCIGWH